MQTGNTVLKVLLDRDDLTSNAQSMLQLACRCSFIRQDFLGSWFLSYCSQPTGGARCRFTGFSQGSCHPSSQFIVETQKESILYVLSHHNIPKWRCSVVGSKTFVLLEHARVSPSLMWQDVFLRSKVMRLHLLFDEEKSNVYALLFQINLWISLQHMRFQFSTKWKTKWWTASLTLHGGLQNLKEFMQNWIWKQKNSTIFFSF